MLRAVAHDSSPGNCGLPSLLSKANLCTEMCIPKGLTWSAILKHKSSNQQVETPLIESAMQVAMQRSTSHSFAMSSGCKGAPAHHATPPMASAHTQSQSRAVVHSVIRVTSLVTPFTHRRVGRPSRGTFCVRADAEYGASWKDSQEAFLVLVILTPFLIPQCCMPLKALYLILLSPHCRA